MMIIIMVIFDPVVVSFQLIISEFLRPYQELNIMIKMSIHFLSGLPYVYVEQPTLLILIIP